MIQQSSRSLDYDNSIIIDTPNTLFYHKHRGEKQIQQNIMALIALVGSGLNLIATLTPKMYSYNFILTSNLGNLIENNNGQIIPVNQDEDPDLIVLKKSKELNIPLLTNDKFKQKKYSDFRSVTIIRYEVIQRRIIPKNNYWKKVWDHLN